MPTSKAPDDPPARTNGRAELEHEQRYVSMLYRRLDTLRDHTRDRLRQALRHDGGGSRQALVDRDAFVARFSDRLARLLAAEHGLCFGRLDRRDGSRLYIGRLGLSDEEQERVLVDWRAPAAQSFYRATAFAPDGAVRRRHLRTRGRQVIGFDDDVLDLDALSDEERGRLNGEAALLAALGASRTGRMADIVATIQAEQDRVIRSGLAGILVVQGGPGTGKTAVALHRAAYLLYTHRQRLARRGVLVLGPNSTFLRYIEQVLPSLGESDVLLSTVEELFPGVTAAATEPVEAAAVKGDPRMAAVLARAVRDRQQVPRAALELAHEGHVLRLDPATCERALRRARDTGAPHNRARAVFERALLEALTDQVVDRLTRELPEVELPEDDDLLAEDVPAERLLDPERDDIRAELAAAPEVRGAIDRLWPALTPQRLLADLFGSPARLEVAAPELTGAERALLLRPAPDGGRGHAAAWTPADVPLLDEAAELLGDDGAGAARAAARRAERERRDLAEARAVLAAASIGDAARYAPDTSRVDPAALAARYHRRGGGGTIAQRAVEDRGWIFGHVIVDEAQEVPPMAWRMILRRCPSRSMTVVGDLAQTSAPWGAGSWARVLDAHAPGRWREERLTVNYRTPAEIMAVAGDVLAGAAGDLRPPRSVRSTGVVPWSLRVEGAELAARLPEVVAAEAAEAGDGKVAVIVPAGRVEELGRRVAAALPGTAVDEGPAALDAPVAVLTVAQAKGLEFDAVVVVEPAAILTGSPHGANDLYVALTRTTSRLGVVHTGDLPPALARLRPRQGEAGPATP